jgi:hypothetical protein
VLGAAARPTARWHGEGDGLGVQVLVELGTNLDALHNDLARRLDPEP